jgi:hypothetical protein
MNSQRHIHTLRVELLAMSRVSQRALDYSVKGFELRNLDFARQVGTANNELEKHYQRIKDLCREAVNGGIANPSDFRLAFAALSIAAALHVTYSAAAEIAKSTILLHESARIERCAQLKQLGQTVNASMRLCIIALFERDAYYARTALRNGKQAVQLDIDSQSDCGLGPRKDFESTVIRGLTEVTKQTHEIADALLFWLEGNNMFWVGSTSEVTQLSREVPRAVRERDATLYIQSQRDLASSASQNLSC